MVPKSDRKWEITNKSGFLTVIDIVMSPRGSPNQIGIWRSHCPVRISATQRVYRYQMCIEYHNSYQCLCTLGSERKRWVVNNRSKISFHKQKRRLIINIGDDIYIALLNTLDRIRIKSIS